MHTKITIILFSVRTTLDPPQGYSTSTQHRWLHHSPQRSRKTTFNPNFAQLNSLIFSPRWWRLNVDSVCIQIATNCLSDHKTMDSSILSVVFYWFFILFHSTASADARRVLNPKVFFFVDNVYHVLFKSVEGFELEMWNKYTQPPKWIFTMYI